MRYYTPSRLTEHISETPEGFLVCPGVAIARTGSQRYAPDEVPEDVTDGMPDDARGVLVHRSETEVFAPRTLASFEGKPLTIDHPDEDVTPDNWGDLAVGHVQNVRRGDPAQNQGDLVLADIVVTRADAVEAVKNGLRDLSCGYDAEYEAIRPGVGRQIHITGNHVALVEHGRAGARCRINDGETFMTKGQRATSLADGVASGSERIAKAAGAAGFTSARMETPPKQGWWDRIMGNPKVRAAVRDAEAEEAAAKSNDEDTPPAKEPDRTSEQAADEGDPVAASLDEIKLLLRTLTEALKPAPTSAGDEKSTADEESTGDEDPVTDEEPARGEEAPAKACDKARYADADTVRRARLIAPRLACRVGDSAAVVRRLALDEARLDPALARVVDGIMGGSAGTGMAGTGMAAQQAAFIAASELAAARNNRRTGDALAGHKARDTARPPGPADINKLNADFYGKRG